VAALPKATEVFSKYRIDFCCGGSQPLSEVLRDKGIDAEEVLSALIKQYENNHSHETLAKAVEAFDQLEEEHEGAGDILKEMRQITSEYTLPSDACSTFDRTYALLQELVVDLFQHIHLENNILHPRLRAELEKRS